MKLYKRNKLIFGVGINDANYNVCNLDSNRKIVWVCPIYSTWVHMLERCYYKKLKEKLPTYKHATCDIHWLTFSCFSIWMKSKDFAGKELDKDIIVVGNKHYDSENCAFVDQKTNKFVTDAGKMRGKYLIGVSLDKGKFKSSINNTFTKKREFLAWKKRKHELALQLADLQTDVRVAEALRTRYL